MTNFMNYVNNNFFIALFNSEFICFVYFHFTCLMNPLYLFSCFDLFVLFSCYRVPSLGFLKIDAYVTNNDKTVDLVYFDFQKSI